MQIAQRCPFRQLLLILSFLPATLFVNAQAVQKKKPAPRLGYRSVKLLTINGLQFKDLNRNGRLDRYEDWRLSYEQRAKDLLSKMTMEEKAGFMLISSTALKNESSFGGQGTPAAAISSDFNEEDRVSTTNVFTRKPLPYPIMNIAGTTKGVTQFHLRHFILRANTSARIIATWANKLQALCEADGLGIPAIIASNPRNNLAKDASVGLSVGKTVFSTWPGELGLSAMHDLSLVHEFADIARKEWKAVGLRKGYMYMADLSTEPRWQRIEGTFGENADWVAQMMTAIVLGFQGPVLDSNAVALTTKHFPGGGAGKGGQDPHFDWGKVEHFPGGKFENNLIPFKAAIKAGTSAIMPYYSMPHNTPYDTIAYAYNKAVIHDLLRVKLKFNGIINSDTGPIEMMPWGAENLSITERYKKTLEAGVNLYSGTADPAKLLETIKSGMVDSALVDASVFRLLMEKFKLGLFENPYVDEEAAEQIVGSAPFQQRANLAMRKSIVLLRNNNKALPLPAKTKVYFESYYQKKGATPSHVFSNDAEHSYPIEFVATPEAADIVLLWLTPGSKSLFESDGSPIYLSLSKNGIDTAYVNSLSAKKPTILVVNYTNPWVIDEIYNPATISRFKAVLATFNTTPEALLDVITGKFNPSGKLPFTTPVSASAVEQQLSDVPGYLKGPSYPLFKYGEGLRYK
ncbi:MAG TPA: glycoside hydrolase family 3 protein [Chitinophagaceae bacterium]|nr:glycoside hydrolase family 3 protein [Chitinophagaceae bacterium]